MGRTVDELWDRLDIEALYHRYVHAADDGDLAALDAIFDLETVLDWREQGWGILTWREARHSDIMTGKVLSSLFHVCANILIEFDDGRRHAKVRSKTISGFGIADPSGQERFFQAHGTYHDRLERRDGRWHFLERRWQQAWIVGGEKAPVMGSGGGDGDGDGGDRP